tara:strand:+ start:189 stop:377 length:189 start_codon:yes stop_codon:yes gene_type:complete
LGAILVGKTIPLLLPGQIGKYIFDFGKKSLISLNAHLYFKSGKKDQKPISIEGSSNFCIKRL